MNYKILLGSFCPHHSAIRFIFWLLALAEQAIDANKIPTPLIIGKACKELR